MPSGFRLGSLEPIYLLAAPDQFECGIQQFSVGAGPLYEELGRLEAGLRRIAEPRGVKHQADGWLVFAFLGQAFACQQAEFPFGWAASGQETTPMGNRCSARNDPNRGATRHFPRGTPHRFFCRPSSSNGSRWPCASGCWMIEVPVGVRLWELMAAIGLRLSKRAMREAVVTGDSTNWFRSSGVPAERNPEKVSAQRLPAFDRKMSSSSLRAGRASSVLEEEGAVGVSGGLIYHILRAPRMMMTSTTDHAAMSLRVKNRLLRTFSARLPICRERLARGWGVSSAGLAGVTAIGGDSRMPGLGLDPHLVQSRPSISPGWDWNSDPQRPQ